MVPNIAMNDGGSLGLIDGPNIDGVLGQVLGCKPIGAARPRWDRIQEMLAVKLCCRRTEFVMNGTIPLTEGSLAFCRFLRSNRFEVERPSRVTSDQLDPVDAYITERIEATCGGRLVVLSHDHGYALALSAALRRGVDVTIIGFKEWLSPALVGLLSHGATLLDLETDIGGFRQPLRRTFRVA